MSYLISLIVCMVILTARVDAQINIDAKEIRKISVYSDGYDICFSTFIDYLYVISDSVDFGKTTILDRGKIYAIADILKKGTVCRGIDLDKMDARIVVDVENDKSQNIMVIVGSAYTPFIFIDNSIIILSKKYYRKFFKEIGITMPSFFRKCNTCKKVKSVLNSN